MGRCSKFTRLGHSLFRFREDCRFDGFVCDQGARGVDSEPYQPVDLSRWYRVRDGKYDFFHDYRLVQISFQIAEFRPTIEPSPTKEPVLKKARRGIVSPQKRQLYWSDPFETVITAIRSKSENQALHSAMLIDSPAPKSLRTVYSQPSTSDSFDDFVLPKSDGIPSNTYLVKVQLNSGTTTSMGKRVHDTILNSLSDRNKLEFEKEWLCKNTFRIVHKDSTKMIELETAALFEVFFEAIGVDPSNFPFMDLVGFLGTYTDRQFCRSRRQKGWTSHWISTKAKRRSSETTRDTW